MKALCIECGSQREGIEVRCKKCGGIFEISVDTKYKEKVEENYQYIKEWVTLGEVETPIIDFENLSLKLEYFSPTFSYKDRGTKVMISYLKSKKSEYQIAEINEDSSGNAGASVAAYGRRASFNVNIFVPEATSVNKVNQIESYGANIFKVPGSREDVRIAAENHKGVYASHVLTPEFRDGIRTLAYEIFKQRNGRVPDRIYIPVSAGTLMLGVFNGFKHLLDSGEIERVPEIIAVQTEQVSPLCSKINNLPYDPDKPIDSIADALISTRPPLLNKMFEVISDFGRCIAVSEEEIKSARRNLSLLGVFAEYSSATVYAAHEKYHPEGDNMLIITGNGLKNVIL